MAVVCPGDAWEVRAVMRAALEWDHPVYIRLGKRGEPLVHTETPEDFRIGKVLPIRDGTDVCLLSTGTMLPEVIEAAHLLSQKGISSRVVSFHTVKPLDTDFLGDVLSRFDLVVTVEEHALIGGFGAAVAEWMTDNAVVPRKFLRFGTPDAFFKKSGEQEYARMQLGLGAHQMATRIMTALETDR
jgi:transketolase